MTRDLKTKQPLVWPVGDSSPKALECSNCDSLRSSLESYKAAASLATGRADKAEADLAAAQRVVEACKAWADHIRARHDDSVIDLLETILRGEVPR